MDHPKDGEEYIEYEVWCDGELVAMVTSECSSDAEGEATRYASIYANDGPVEVFRVRKAYELYY